jgi:hypothetical protein
LRDIDASQGTAAALGGRSSVNAGRICGMIATVLLVLGALAVVGVLAIGVSGSTSP